MFEHSITCAVCGYHLAQGGFDEPQDALSPADVIAASGHNPGCPVPGIAASDIPVRIDAQADSKASHATRYTIRG